MRNREFFIEGGLKKTLRKLERKDKETYEAVLKKIDEIICCEDVNHYKNLKYPLQAFKRVHINGPFVMVFAYIESKDTVVFCKLKHHDNIYA
ncbi:MAG: addiction module toxin RelE [Nanoarchaeota archaeon]